MVVGFCMMYHTNDDGYIQIRISNIITSHEVQKDQSRSLKKLGPREDTARALIRRPVKCNTIVGSFQDS